MIRSSLQPRTRRHFLSDVWSCLAPVPGFVAHANMTLGPQCEQTWLTCSFFPDPLPVPTTVTVPPQTHLCFSPIVINLTGE